MTNKTMKKTFKYTDIFKSNGEATEFSLPPEVVSEMKLEPGDKLKVLLGDQGTIILEKIDGQE